MSFGDTFKALSDPARRQILELLKKGPLSAGDIASHFEMTGATISSKAYKKALGNAFAAYDQLTKEAK